MIRFTEPQSGFSVDVQSYQWGYEDGTTYVQREFGTSAAGVLYRERVADVTSRTLQVTFEGSRSLAESIRTLTYLAMRHGGRVQFYPDTADLGTYRWIDWQSTMENAHLMDWRHRIELTLVEQAA